MEVWFYTIASVLIVSVVSLIGVMTLSLGKNTLEKILILLVSFSAGTLLGDAFIHLIPESMEGGNGAVSIYILSGLLFFFVLEKFIHWRHCHEAGCPEHSHALPSMILVGDGLHNFIDGMIIAASYLISIPVGIATTIAVLFHEIPQEIGDFGVLVHGGFSKTKALFYNFASASTSVLGAVLVLVASSYSENAEIFLVPFAAGGFIYIATADIIPELHKHKSHKLSESFKQLTFFVAGIFVMWLLLFLE
ncbi:MAG TPA: ZIP family metal transporter [Candidatus Moranbacteria bacterium]|nr:ZIP family metal transporter [Candidatus Moranbacteria bacterium]